MTNFEKWKQRLTIEAVSGTIGCDNCPALIFCNNRDYLTPDNKERDSNAWPCGEVFEVWGNLPVK